MSLNKLRDAFRRFNEKNNEPVRNFTNGKLVSINGSVDVPDRPGYVWAVEDGDSVPFQVLNLSVQATENLPVVFGRSLKFPYEREVLKLNPDIVNLPGFNGTDPFLALHAASHQWPEGEKGNDAVMVYQPALQMLKTVESSGLSVYVSPTVYANGNTRKYFTGATVDVSTYVPSSGYKRYILISLDPVLGAVDVSIGATVGDYSAITAPMPSINASYIPSAYILLTGGMSSVSDSNIIDARLFLHNAPIKDSTSHLINGDGLIIVDNSGTIISSGG